MPEAVIDLPPRRSAAADGAPSLENGMSNDCTPIGTFDVVVVGGGPSGATAAHELAQRGRSVLLLDRDGRIKPCGGAIPPRLIEDFAIPDQLVAPCHLRAHDLAGRRKVDIPIEGGFVGMVDRDTSTNGCASARRPRRAARTGRFERIERDADGTAVVDYWQPRAPARAGSTASARARCVIGADGARSGVARRPSRAPIAAVRLRVPRDPAQAPAATGGYDGSRCDVTTAARCRPTSTAGCSRTARPERRHRQRRQGVLAAPRRGRVAREIGLG
jgi:geranylgeranyl reductase